MKRRSRRSGFALLIAGVACGLAGCGSSVAASSSGAAGAAASARIAAEENPSLEQLTGGRDGGTLIVVDAQGFQNLDPGAAHDALDYGVIAATQRTLYSYLPNDATTPVPDLASGQPQVSANGLTVTVHIRSGVHFSPPVDREVNAGDVEYAIDRGANPNVGNVYFKAYFGDLVGAASARGGPFPGVTVPNPYTIVFHLTRPTAAILVAALTLPLSAPVPPEYAKRFDAYRPSRYADYQVATGPYMIRSDARGAILGVGYQPGRWLALVRNPNWDPTTDFRPAYLDAIDVDIGGTPTTIGDQVLGGSDMVQNSPVPNSIAQFAYQQYPTQLTVTPGTGTLWVSLNNHRGPFANVDLRRAVYAALDRSAMVAATGGALDGSVATHFIYPGSGGYERAGAAAGPQYDFNEYQAGKLTVALRYMKLAGYRSGRFSGPPISLVGAAGEPGAALAQITSQTLQRLGFRVRTTLVAQSAMYTRDCGVPAAEIDVCTSAGRVRELADPQTILDGAFNGKYIVASDNANFGQVNLPAINAQMDAAELIISTSAREAAWARIDDELVAWAVAVPFEFTSSPMIESADVAGVNQQWNEGLWDYSFTSLK